MFLLEISIFYIIQQHNMFSNYPITFDETNQVNTTRTFNKSDFTANNQSATVADLKYYAHKFKSNLFTETNYFNGILVNSINEVTDTILTYLSTITENVQTAINYCKSNIVEILRITTNFGYNTESDMTTINSNVKMERLTIENNVNAKVVVVSDYINATQINNHTLLTKNITAQQINCQNIRCNNMISSNDVSVYIYYGNKTIPLQRSQTIRNILPDATSPFTCTLTIKQSYKVIFLDAQDKRLTELRNDYPQSNDFIYNMQVNLSVKPYKINIYYENVLLK
jgi:hypothetical protein